MWHWPQFHQHFLFIKFFPMPIHQYTIWYYIYFSTFFNFSNLSAEEISAVGISQALSDKEPSYIVSTEQQTKECSKDI